jgi:hypothetical protein
MNKSEFEEIPSVLERLKPIWEKINSNKSGTVTLDKSERHAIKESFMSAVNFENFYERWDKAHELFYNKDETGFNYDKALREAVEIMGLVENATKPGKKRRLHPNKDEQIREYYTRFDAFYFKGEDGLYYDDEGNAGEIEENYRKKSIISLANKFGFASPRAAEEYLRDTLHFKNVPSFKDHSKKQK